MPIKTRSHEQKNCANEGPHLSNVGLRILELCIRNARSGYGLSYCRWYCSDYAHKGEIQKRRVRMASFYFAVSCGNAKGPKTGTANPRSSARLQYGSRP